MNLDWNKLGFEYIPTDFHIRYTYENGEWHGGRLLRKHTITMPIAATCLHYGQACFEGLKAFSCKDGKVRIFRPLENARRMNSTADYLLCPHVPEEIFVEAVRKVIKANLSYVPPYGTKGSLYVRPLLIGTGARIGVAPSDKYDFIVFVTPVGNYYKSGISPVNAIILDDFDRAAPRGTGHIKMGGNYAASLKPASIAKKMGFPIVLYLDPKTKSLVDEFGTSNFIGITKDGHYVTPDSKTVLPSITNDSLFKIALDFGMPAEKRPVPIEELPHFSEVGACGTAVVITPIEKIAYGEKIFQYGNTCGPMLKKLYDRVTSIQCGESPDIHNWMMGID